MKSHRRFYRLFVTMLAVVGVLAMTAAPALAAVSISLSVIKGTVGTEVQIWGVDFTEDSFYTIHFGSGTPVCLQTNSIIEAGGVFSDVFIVPNLPAGRYPVKVTTDAGDSSPTVYFTIRLSLQITLSASSGYVGDQLTISGTGFTAASTAKVLFDGAQIGSLVNTTSAGTFTDTTITVPETCGGSHTIGAKDITSGNDVPTLSYIVLPKIIISPVSGGVGDQVTVSGLGFGASSSLGVYFDSSLIPTQAVMTTNLGSFSNVIFSIPVTARGEHTVEVRGAGGPASATFTVGQKATITPDSGPVGTTVTVSGTGYTPYQPISIKFNGIPVVTTPSLLFAGHDGGFAGGFIVSGSAGTYVVDVSGGGGVSFLASFTVITTGNFEPVEGNVGTGITVSGTGFVPNALAIVTFDSVEMTSANVDTSGAFTATFKAPAVKGGSYQVVATDGVNSISSAFAMEATVPQVPGLLLPAASTRADRVPTFDWDDVADPSGVTYNFQLATDASFKNVLIEEKDLADSEFSIAKENKLEPASKEEPYYWRVQAIDGAFNEGGWSLPSSFYTGFQMPTWGLYTLFAVGALLFGIFGFWLGRKTAYY
jgi:hypothetical protein